MTSPTQKILELPDIVLTVQGEKAANFLHGQLSNSITDLKIGEGNWNLLLTNKGKIIAETFVFRKSTADFLLITPQNFVAPIQEHLQRLAPLSRVKVEIDESLKILHLVGSSDDSSLQMWHTDGATHRSPLQITTKRHDENGVDVLIPGEAISKSPLQIMTPSEWELDRVTRGIPKIGVDLTSDNLPQEGGLDARYLHFQKGCYLGQEVIARLHFRGHVTKHLAKGFINGNFHDAENCVMDASKNPIGRVTSSAYNPEKSRTEIIAMIPAKLPNHENLFCHDQNLHIEKICQSIW